MWLCFTPLHRVIALFYWNLYVYIFFHLKWLEIFNITTLGSTSLFIMTLFCYIDYCNLCLIDTFLLMDIYIVSTLFHCLKACYSELFCICIALCLVYSIGWIPRGSITGSKNMGTFNLHRYCWIAPPKGCTDWHSKRKSVWNFRCDNEWRGIFVGLGHHPLPLEPHSALQIIQESVYRWGRSCPKCLLCLVSCSWVLAWFPKQGFRKGFPRRGRWPD